MNRYFSIAVFSLFLFLSACSSVKSDAEDAVDLVIESLEYTRDGKLDKAEKTYKEYRKIEAKYKNTADYGAFMEAYNKYYKEKAIASKE